MGAADFPKIRGGRPPLQGGALKHWEEVQINIVPWRWDPSRKTFEVFARAVLRQLIYAQHKIKYYSRFKTDSLTLKENIY